jgi:hypothetical protein
MDIKELNLEDILKNATDKDMVRAGFMKAMLGLAKDIKESTLAQVPDDIDGVKITTDTEKRLVVCLHVAMGNIADYFIKFGGIPNDSNTKEVPETAH